MTEELVGTVKQSSKSMMLFGILTIILGVVAMMAPLMTGISIVMLVGFLVLGGGIARMIWAFGSESLGQGTLKFAIGLLTLLCGLVMLANPVLALAPITIILAAYFFVDGLFEAIGAFQIRPQAGWGWLLFGGIISLALGVMIWRQYPLSGGWAIGILVGIKLLFAGLAMVTVGSTLRSVGNEAARQEFAMPIASSDEE